jgi:hypothetical protein
MGLRIEIAFTGQIDEDGDVFTEECLRQAAASNPYLKYDERSGSLYAEGILSFVKAGRRHFLEMWRMSHDEVSVSGTCPPAPEDLEIEEAVIEEIRRRRELGRAKYKKTMEREDLGTLQWAQHALEESLDHSVYLKKFMREHRRRLEGYRGLLEKAADMILYYDAEYTNDDELPSIVPEIRAAIQEITEELNGVSSI